MNSIDGGFQVLNFGSRVKSTTSVVSIGNDDDAVDDSDADDADTAAAANENEDTKGACIEFISRLLVGCFTATAGVEFSSRLLESTAAGVLGCLTGIDCVKFATVKAAAAVVVAIVTGAAAVAAVDAADVAIVTGATAVAAVAAVDTAAAVDAVDAAAVVAVAEIVGSTTISANVFSQCNSSEVSCNSSNEVT